MKPSPLLLAAALLAGSAVTTTAYAQDRYSGVTLTRGTVYSIGRADPRGDALGNKLDSGIFVDANYSSVAFNGGLGAKDFNGSRVANIYGGIGLGRLLQLQVGYGDRGSLGRLRTDINLRSIHSFFTQNTQPAHERTLADRVTFTYTMERYSDDKNEEFNNGTIGIGLLFAGPF